MTNFREHVSVEAASNIETWLTQPKYAEYKTELEEMIQTERWSDLEDAFFKVIEFGTGGRRGTTGIGSNRINRVTIGESAQALCLYAQNADPDAAQKGIVIACDTRLSSPELSEYAASVCAANGFKTYVFDSFRATPELSFAVRHLGAAAGIVISASHNPPADNGFKAYWSDGGQLVPPHDKGVLQYAADVEMINAVDFADAVTNGSIMVIGKDIDDAYLSAVVDQAEGTARDVSIVYSPLHGAGQTNTLLALRRAGFDVTTVDEQMVPDGNFPTIENGKPNPEERSANDHAVARLLADDADIAITNDPDADRVGIMVRQDDEAIYLTGNQSAVLATEYALRKQSERGDLTSKHYIAKTIVTTDMLTAIADAFGVKTYGDMLIGFKYIGRLLRDKESTDEKFVIGGEESYGLLKGEYARDKDGAGGALPLAEYAAELKLEGKTLWDRMLELYREYGLYVEQLKTMVYPGAQGFSQMQAIMKGIRDEPVTEVDGHAVTAVLDYQTLECRDLQSGAVSSINCDAGNVYVMEFGDERRRITVRPSGTEPKLKFYVQWHAESDAPETDYVALQQKLENMARELEGILLERAGTSAE